MRPDPDAVAVAIPMIVVGVEPGTQAIIDRRLGIAVVVVVDVARNIAARIGHDVQGEPVVVGETVGIASGQS